jgi:hypothetical protein
MARITLMPFLAVSLVFWARTPLLVATILLALIVKAVVLAAQLAFAPWPRREHWLNFSPQSSEGRKPVRRRA